MGSNLTRHKVLEMLRNREISSVEAFQLIKKMQNTRNIAGTPPQKKTWDIAIIGMSCQFPQARDFHEYWHNLASGKNSVTEIPRERWDVNKIDIPEVQKRGRWGGFLADIHRFDPLFFNISPLEAEVMDPQQRLFLQEAWRALEDAGYSDRELSGKKCGVFVGCSGGDYIFRLREGGIKPIAYAFMGNAVSILPARISYHLNLQGPAVAVDTACSSSLVALHLACVGIRTGTCEMAIVGGVQVITTSQFHILASLTGMLSPQGQCKAFDDSADGFVPGEGVGAVILKSLDAAREDGDHIYAVIKGCDINQDGKSNGITAPSATSQTALECEVYNKFAIHPETISYIETHGTGTILGDPIEIDALTDAFREYTQKKQFCALGSVKTNIGHALTAAGVASVIKVLLALQHKKIPPSLHFKKENRHIRFKNSPFYVETQLKEWVESSGKPRRAAISSFGFSGTNAHVIIEEAPPGKTRLPVPQKPCYLIALSAKTPEALEQKLKDLLHQLPSIPGEEASIANISYTLLIGRSQFSYRIALVVKDLTDLKDTLNKIIAREKVNNVFKNDSEIQSDQKPMMKQLGNQLIETLANSKFESEGKYEETLFLLANLYIQGYDLSWEILFKKGIYTRISLPAYPFANEHYFIPGDGHYPDAEKNRAHSLDHMHPLLNQLDFAGSLTQDKGFVFETVLRPDDTILAHHQVKHRPIFPGVGYLEMAAAAAKQIQPAKTFILKETTWVQPLIVEKEQIIRLKLELKEGCFHFQVVSNSHEPPVVHGSGEIHYVSCSADAETLDIEALKQGLSPRFDQSPGKELFYGEFSRKGIEYGEYFRGIRALWGSDQHALGLIRIPDAYLKEIDRYHLHPALMDAALQCCAGVELAVSPNVYLPFSLGTLEFYSKLTPTMYSYITKVAENRFHAVLVNPQGKVCLKFKDFVLRPLKNTLDNMLYIPLWVREPRHSDSLGTAPSTSAKLLLIYHDHGFGLEKHLVNIFKDENCLHLHLGMDPQREAENHWWVRFEDPQGIQRIFSQLPSFDKIYFLGGLHSKVEDSLDISFLEERQELGVLSLFRAIKALAAAGYTGKELEIVILTQDCHYLANDTPIDPGAAGLIGLTKSLAKEYPHWKIKNLDLSRQWLADSRDHGSLVNCILSEPSHPRGDSVVYRNGLRYVQKILPAELPALQHSSFRQKGVYVIVGGAGGIGYVTTGYLVKKYRAKVIWLGRRRLNDDIQNKINTIAGEGEGVAPVYIQADITDPNSLMTAVQQLKRQFAEIHGVIHSAIVLQDQSLEKMTEERFRQSLDPKVKGSILLAKAFEKEKLDWLCFFSSMQSFSGAPGQSNYAAGCTFKDTFAHALRQRLAYPVHIINWGYWGSVGVVANHEYRTRLARLGVFSLEPLEGMEIFQRTVSLGVRQIIPMKIADASLRELGLDPGRKVYVYPPEQPSYLQAIIGQLPDSSAALQNIARQTPAYEALEQFALEGLKKALDRLGCFDEFTGTKNIDQLRQGLGILDKYQRLFRELVRTLTREEYLYREGDCVGLKKNPTSLKEEFRQIDPDKGAEVFIRKYPGFKAHIGLLKPCLHNLPDILTGKIPATDIIFPNSSPELVEGIYKGNEKADYFNERVADLVEAYVKERLKDSKKVRILEVGAGTGGTSAFIFKRLKAWAAQVEYTYTDISRSFFRYAQEHYIKENSYVELRLFDVEKTLAEQDMPGNYFDMVVATNVLHATRDIVHSLDQVKAALKTNGLLILNEITSFQAFSLLTFGLLEGWWLYRDKEIRLPGSPVLPAENWQRLLQYQGFDQVTFITPGTREIGQMVIAAQSSGVVRQAAAGRSKFSDPGLQAESKTVISSHTPEQGTGIKRNIEPDTEIDVGILKKETNNYLKRLLASTLKMPPHRIEEKAPLEKYGIDSIMVVELTNQLDKVFGKLSRTLFFEYQTIDQLAGYFIDKHRDKLPGLLNISTTTSNDTAAEKKSPPHPEPGKEKSLEKTVPPIIYHHQPRQDIFPQESTKDIAIIGLSGHYPQAGTLEAFWDNLKSGRDCIIEIPADRWDYRQYYDPDNKTIGKMSSKWGGFMDDADKFDPLFFNISPMEAELIDPQERLFLETAAQTLEDAGYTGTALQKFTVGVFAGVMYGEYQLLQMEEVLNGMTMPGNSSFSSVANRVSYHFNFHGPSIALDTMCASSLTALHLAYDSICHGDCDFAIAGGVNLSLHPLKYINASKSEFYSTDGRCRSFGEGGNGFVPGEGVGAVLLRPLDKAIAAGDHIYAVIKGSVINHGGKTNGYTVPNPNAQAELIAKAIEKTGINPRTITFIEAHGTGTALGDPIEITGLNKAFEKFTRDKQFCSIGSVKSNIGHLESAASIAGLTKILLQMKYKQLVPSIHSQKLNPNIDFSNSPFYVQQDLAEWTQPVVSVNGKEQKYPRRAGVSSFGAGGSNAHLILEEYNAIPAPSANREDALSLVVLSAKNRERLKEYARRMVDFLLIPCETLFFRQTFEIKPPKERRLADREWGAGATRFLKKSESPCSANQPGKREIIQKIQQDLLKLASGIIHVDQKDIALIDNLDEYGFDPIHITGLANRVNDTYSLDIPVDIFFKRPSISSLAEYLYEEYPGLFTSDYMQESNGIGGSSSSVRHQPPQPSQPPPFDLTRLAYTLQVGREPMKERIALIVSNRNQLLKKLEQYCNGNMDIEDFYSGTIKSEHQGEELMGAANKDNDQLKNIRDKKTLKKLAQWWVAGVDIDWSSLYPLPLPQRISLPTYPFARERCWLPEVARPTRDMPDKQEGDIKRESPPLQIDELYIKQKIRESLMKFLEDILKIKAKDIDVQGNMMEYGFDSISFTQYIKRINKTYDIHFAYESFFDLGKPTVQSLSNCLFEQFKDRFFQYFREDLLEITNKNEGKYAGKLETVTRGNNHSQTRVPAAEVRMGHRDIPHGNEPIAVIGISGIMPQADNLDTFWQHLQEGKNLLADFPGEREPLTVRRPGREISTGPKGGFLKEIDSFDHGFFGISPAEAEIMDPQQRIFLETTWKVIEDAGYKASALSGSKTGVFIGAAYSGFSEMIAPFIDKEKIPLLARNTPTMIANRISYFFNWHGPSESIDTGSSSSLVAVHRAVQALRNRTCRMAAAGGIHIIFKPHSCHDGASGTSADRTNGYCPGEGVGAVFLKPLKNAEADNDHIYGIIKGTAENHAGRFETFMSMNLNGPALTELFIDAYEGTQIDPGTVTYIETHGSGDGSNPGSSTEIQALQTAFTRLHKQNDRQLPKAPYCGIGTVKNNIGHLEAASGIAGLTKILLSMKHKKLPAALHPEGEEINPPWKMNGSPFYPVSETKSWECLVDSQNQPIPRRAGVSAFGRGGTNAHVVLEEWPGTRSSTKPDPDQGVGEREYLILLSAKNRERLKAYAGEMVNFLDTILAQAEPSPCRESPSPGKKLRQEIERDILKISAETLKTNAAGYDPDSIAHFIRQINRNYHLDITGELFDTRPSIGAFIKFLRKNYQDKCADFYIKNQPGQPGVPQGYNLENIAYTLQVGREEMEERLVVAVSSIREMKEKLHDYQQGKTDIEGLTAGNIKDSPGQTILLEEGEEKEVFIKSLIKNQKLTKLAYCWVLGVQMDWKWLYPHHLPKRISLPTYPFEKTRYPIVSLKSNKDNKNTKRPKPGTHS